MNLKKEADLLEQVLSIAETDYAQAYRFLLDAYEKSPAAYGPQTLYFLAPLQKHFHQLTAAHFTKSFIRHFLFPLFTI